jgi:DNA-binding protein H-NS
MPRGKVAKPRRKEYAKSKRKAAAKYRNADGSKTWSGRGRRPAWLPKNKSKAARFLIKKAA